MPISPARKAAFEVLQRVSAQQAYAVDLLHSASIDKMSAADRSTVRQAMSSGLWAGFAKQYPPTAPLFEAIQSARA